MNFTMITGLVYVKNSNVTQLVGPAAYMETQRIDNQTVIDISYGFDLEQGQYIEISRAVREETLPQPLPTPEKQRITQLEADNLTLMESIADLYELMLEAE